VTVDLSEEEKALLEKLEKHTHVCGLCFPLYHVITVRGEGEGVAETWSWEITALIKPNIEAALKKPKDRRKFVFIQSQDMWFHASCWKWLQHVDRKSERG
jgi:hypothetical protein